jgi:hypothetical protein
MTTNQSYEPKAAAITPVEYGGLQTAFEHFNVELCGGALPNCMIVYQRKPHMLGHFCAKRFVDRDGEVYHGELALNPDGFINQSDRDICSTLVHEMKHVQQEANGTAPKRGYHDKEWGAMMKAVGLYPSNSGMVGGRETGQQMHHYIIDGGLFDRSYERLRAKGWRLNLQSAPIANPSRSPTSKTKFTCLGCGANAWGKPDLLIGCIRCGRVMPPAGMSAEDIAKVEQLVRDAREAALSAVNGSYDQDQQQNDRTI